MQTREKAVGRQRKGASEDNFRGLLESAPDAVVIVDAAGLIQIVNRQTELLFGYPRAELLGQPVEVLVPERFRGRHMSHRARYQADPTHVRWAQMWNCSACAEMGRSFRWRSA